MNHLNKWYWFSWTDAYQTYDYVQCPKCYKTAIECYHTEFIDLNKWLPRVEINLIYN